MAVLINKQQSPMSILLTKCSQISHQQIDVHNIHIIFWQYNIHTSISLRHDNVRV